MTTEGPFGSTPVDLPFSDKALLLVSACGFAVLAVIIYSLLVSRLKSGEELRDSNGDAIAYEEMLKRSDVSSLSRAERRARAHAIMKDKRRLEQGNGEDNNEPQPLDGKTLSRKQRQKAAKALEREERRLFESERVAQQLAAQEAAHKEKLRREELEAKRIQEETQREKDGQEARDKLARGAHATFLGCQSVVEWVTEMEGRRSVDINEVAKKFAVTSQVVIDRLQQLVKEERVTGVVDGGFFLFFKDEEMKAIARAVVERGSVSFNDLSDITLHICNGD
jgi:hypothetical protein